MEPIEFVHSQPPFDRLAEAELEPVAAALKPARFPRNHRILVRGGQPSRFLYLIREGAVRLEHEGQAVQLLEEGELFGYASLLSGNPPAFDVIAAEGTLVYQIPEAAFRPLLEHPALAEFFLKGLSQRLQRASSRETSPLAGNMTTPVETLASRAPVFVSAAASVAEAAQCMRQAGISSVLVAGQPPGILTDRDLRSRVLAEGLGPETPARQVMSQPLKTLPAETPVYAALLFMLQENIHHLPLTQHSRIVGVITDTDLLRHQLKSPVYLLKQVGQLAGVNNLAQYARDIAGMVESLFKSGLDGAQIGRIVATVNDALVRQLLKLAEAELGPPPTPYAWIVFGSEGRQEQALLSDQDNALIYRDSSVEAETYFKALAGLTIKRLTEAGFPPCPGGYMATRWCYPLREWERFFKNWIQVPDEQALLEAAIFFDFRKVYGELALDPLEQMIQQASEHHLFLAHLARAALGFQPPLSFFRQIRADKEGVDLKKGGIGPVMGLARLFALEAGSPARSTLAQLQAAGQAKILTSEEVDLLGEAYRFILNLRLREQLHAYRTAGALSGWVRLDRLSTVERRHLKEAFLVIRQMQQVTAARFHTDRLG